MTETIPPSIRSAECASCVIPFVPMPQRDSHGERFRLGNELAKSFSPPQSLAQSSKALQFRFIPRTTMSTRLPYDNFVLRINTL